MKKIFLISMMALMTVASYGRKHVSADAVVASDTIYYGENMLNVSNRSEASYYRLLMTQGMGLKKQDVFQDFYLNGTLKAEGGYSFVDLGNDRNTILNGEITTYYQNGMEKLHGKYMNGKREGYFTLQLRDGSVAVVEYANGKSKYDYFTVTRSDGTMEKRPISEIKSLLQ
ncbi:MAG: hypothetical protein LKG25_08960 [Prevotella sp.]|jgi:VCBS repeat-containing protein|nr:hypothetical protein [Prevotella sp.]MCI1282704.1 hypothetical protein [Prevotella sp.]